MESNLIVSRDDHAPIVPRSRTSQPTLKLGLRSLRRNDFQLTMIKEQSSELLKTTDHVLTQLREVERLRQLKANALDNQERAWMDSTIHDVTDAARDVAILVEPARAEQEARNGKLSLGRQLRWIYRDSQRAQDKRLRLLACYQSLVIVLDRLQRLDFPATHELEAAIPEKAGCSSPELQTPSALDASFSEDTMKEKQVLEPPSYEMYDMLTWRRSKGATASIECNPSPVRTAGEVDISLG